MLSVPVSLRNSPENGDVRRSVFERAAAEAWLRAHSGLAMLTLQPLPSGNRLITNHALRQMIQQFAKPNSQCLQTDCQRD